MFDHNWYPWKEAVVFFENLIQTSTDQLRNSQNQQVHQGQKPLKRQFSDQIETIFCGKQIWNKQITDPIENITNLVDAWSEVNMHMLASPSASCGIITEEASSDDVNVDNIPELLQISQLSFRS